MGGGNDRREVKDEVRKLHLNLLAKEEHISLSSIQINYLPPLSWRELHKAERELKNAEAALIKAQQEYELVHNKSMN